jgi:hypothetical protein
MNKALQKHLDAIKSGEVTKTNVIGIRKAINRVERLTDFTPDTDDLLNDVFAIVEALVKYKPRVSPDLHASGLKLLLDKRNYKHVDVVGHLLDDIDEFRLVAFDRHGPRWQYSVPFYEVVTKSGKSFGFRNIPWQSGGKGPEVYYPFSA